MIKTLFIACILLCCTYTNSYSQSTLSNYQIAQLAKTMSTHKIVGLGEGTHGTKEFNTVRIQIIKKLITDYGFRNICFENAFGESYFFDNELQSSAPITLGMKKYLISLWQTTELRDFFEWIRSYNQVHKEKVHFVGMDFNYISSTVKIMQAQTDKYHNTILTKKLDSLYNIAEYFDASWDKQLEPFDMNRITPSYRLINNIDSLGKIIDKDSLSLFRIAIKNCKYWLSGEDNRDEHMAKMAFMLANKKKTIVWAHEIHLALKSPFNDNTVGGCGGWIKKMEPTYYALGTGTTIGDYRGTTEQFDTRINKMQIFKLPIPTADTWDLLLMNQIKKDTILNVRDNELNQNELKIRMIGYGAPEHIENSDKVKLGDLFDSYIFIPKTIAPKSLN